jgi:hypothetical protein
MGLRLAVALAVLVCCPAAAASPLDKQVQQPQLTVQHALKAAERYGWNEVYGVRRLSSRAIRLRICAQEYDIISDTTGERYGTVCDRGTVDVRRWRDGRVRLWDGTLWLEGPDHASGTTRPRGVTNS